MTLDDIFFDDNPVHILRALLKTPIFKILEYAWLRDNKSVGKLIGNKVVINFVKKQKDLLKILRKVEIDEIKKSRKSIGNKSRKSIQASVVPNESDGLLKIFYNNSFQTKIYLNVPFF